MPVSHHDGIGIVLLAAGESRRMAAALETPTSTASQTTTSSTPKALLPWLGRPLIQYQLEQIAALEAPHRAQHTSSSSPGFMPSALRPTLSLSRAYALWKTPTPREAELLQSCTA